jgi:hypothetical protein
MVNSDLDAILRRASGEAMPKRVSRMVARHHPDGTRVKEHVAPSFAARLVSVSLALFDRLCSI